MSMPSTLKSRTHGWHHLCSSTRKAPIFHLCLMSAVYSTSVREHSPWHGQQIIHPLGHCSKVVSRCGFRFSILSQRKMNKEHKTPNIPHPSPPAGRWSASAVCTGCISCMSRVYSATRVRRESTAPLMSAIPRCWMHLSSCVGHASPGFLYRASGFTFVYKP